MTFFSRMNECICVDSSTLRSFSPVPHVCALANMDCVIGAKDNGEGKGVRLTEIEVIGFMGPRDRGNRSYTILFTLR